MPNKKIICAALASALTLQCFAPTASLSVFAAQAGELIFFENYDDIEEGKKPAYGSSGWTGDNATAGYTVGAVTDGEGKALKMAATGTGAAISTSLVLYRNISVGDGEVYTFCTDLRTTDDNGYKRLFIRNSNGNTAELVRFDSGRLRIAGENMGKLEKNHNYRIRLKIDGGAKKATLFIDGVQKAGVYLKSFDLKNSSVRIDMVADGTDGAETAIYVDNTAYGKGDFRFEDIGKSGDSAQDENTGEGNNSDSSVSGGSGNSGGSVPSKKLTDAEKALAYMETLRPSADKILADFSEHGGAHPRVLIDGERLGNIRSWIQTNDNFADWYTTVKKKADEQLTQPVCKYELRDGERLLYVSRDVYDHVVYPAFVYAVGGGERYKTRVWRELEAVCGFDDWHPTHFLDTAEMLTAVSIGYDWLYDSWSESQRKILREAILRKGLDAAKEAYDGTAEYGTESGAYHNRIGWINDKSNWGLVCSGGVAMGALAVMGDGETDYCAQMVNLALGSAATPMSLFAPEGVWPEGTSYWEYASRYMSYLFSTLKNSTGSYYGYNTVSGVNVTPYFMIYHTAPKGNFNFGDAGESVNNAPVQFWFAEFLDDPSLNDIRLGLMKQYNMSVSVDNMLFYNPSLSGGDTGLKLDNKFGSVETAMLANNHGDSDSNYIGLRGGTAGTGHGDLDAGTFLIDAIGERWTADWGTDNYNLPNYFFWPGRGDYYRKRAEGHSTLVINPDSGLDQKVGSKNIITDIGSADGSAYALLDMSEAYAEKANSARRLVSLYDDRTKFMVQDEVECAEKSDIWWLMQTRADVSIAADGKTAVLSQNGKHMLCILQSSCKNAVFEVTDAVPFETSPNPSGQAKNIGHRLAVKNGGVKKLSMRVTFVPYFDGETPDDMVTKLSAIDKLINSGILTRGGEVYAKADGITVGGKAITNYAPQQFAYTVKLDAYEGATPEVAVHSGYDTKTEYSADSSRATVTVTDPSGVLKYGVYHITFEKEKLTYTAPQGTKADIAEVSASATVEAENTPENTIDGKSDTKWAAEGRQWIMYDLGAEKDVTAVGTQWLNQTSRTQNYSVELSSDGENWQTVYDGKSSTKSGEMQYVIANAAARFVRISVSGTSAGSWSSLLETAIYTK